MAALTEKVDDLFAEWDKLDSPGCAIAIIRHGQVLYSRGYGMADLEYEVPIAPNTVFDIASNSKQFTALSIVLLARQKKLSLDDEVQKYLPKIRSYGYPITIRHLIHHTSGLRDYCTLMELAGLPFENDYPDEEIFDLIARQRELNFPPGEDHLYSNSGYFLLGQIVKRVSGMPLGAFADDNIFNPLGMKNTHFHDNFSEIVKNRAVGYSAKESGGFRLDISLFDGVGDGGVYTTVEDLGLWDANFYHNIIGGYGQDLIEEMTTPGRLNSGEVLDYAFGLVAGTYRGLRTSEHGGSWMGYKSQLIRFPEQWFSVICLSNLSSVNPTRLTRQVADIYLAEVFTEPEEKTTPREPPFVELSTAEMADKAGFYRDVKSGLIWELTVQAGQLTAEAFGQSFKLVPAGPARYQSVGGPYDLSIEFERQSSDSPLKMRVRMDGDKPDILEKVKPVSVGSDRLADYAGEYASDELGVHYRLMLENGALILSRKNSPPESLKPVSRDLFTGASTAFEFTRNALRQVTGFGVRADWVKRLQFIKQ